MNYIAKENNDMINSSRLELVDITTEMEDLVQQDDNKELKRNTSSIFCLLPLDIKYEIIDMLIVIDPKIHLDLMIEIKWNTLWGKMSKPSQWMWGCTICKTCYCREGCPLWNSNQVDGAWTLGYGFALESCKKNENGEPVECECERVCMCELIFK